MKSILHKRLIVHSNSFSLTHSVPVYSDLRVIAVSLSEGVKDAPVLSSYHVYRYNSFKTQAIGMNSVVGDVLSHKVEENSKVNEARNSEGSVENQI